MWGGTCSLWSQLLTLDSATIARDQAELAYAQSVLARQRGRKNCAVAANWPKPRIIFAFIDVAVP